MASTKGGREVVVVAVLVAQVVAGLGEHAQVRQQKAAQVDRSFVADHAAEILVGRQGEVLVGHDVGGHALGVDALVAKAFGIDVVDAELGRQLARGLDGLLRLASRHAPRQSLADGLDGLVDLIHLLQIVKTLGIGAQHLVEQSRRFPQAGVEPKQVAQLRCQHDDGGLVVGGDLQCGGLGQIGHLHKLRGDLVARGRHAREQQHPIALGQGGDIRLHLHAVALAQAVHQGQWQLLVAALHPDVERRALMDPVLRPHHPTGTEQHHGEQVADLDQAFPCDNKRKNSSPHPSAERSVPLASAGYLSAGRVAVTWLDRAVAAHRR